MNKSTLIIGIILFFTSVAFSQQADFKTLTYFQKDSISLDLDLFLPENYDEVQPLPLVIYAHGGGFSAGTRENGHALARYLAKNNIACASITYTLYMKGKKRGFGCNGIASEKMKAIQIAVSQFWYATAFLNSNSSEYNIDTTKIFAAGYSAGGEMVLHAPFWNREKMQLYEQVLSPSFCYAGVISGSGAIADIDLITCDNMLPMILFHGDEDKVVPYGTAAHHYCDVTAPGWLMLFGSHTIAERLKELDGICELVTIKGGGHPSGRRFSRTEQYFVVDFIRRVLNNEHFVCDIELEK